MAGDGNALTGLWFSGQKHFGETLSADHTERFLPVFAETVRWLDLYFSGGIPGFRPALNPKGTVFRKAVWEILLTIPYGRTMTYGEIAERISGKTGDGRTMPYGEIGERIAGGRGGGRMSARAVGGAVGHNPILLIIPCHRVVGADGRLTGYAGGTDKKARLLQMEQTEIKKRGGITDE